MSERAGHQAERTGLPVPVGLPPRPGVRWPRVLRAEWGKTVSLPPARWGVVVAVVVNAVIAAFVAYNSRYNVEAVPPSLVELLTLGLVATQFPVLALGVLIGATEYPTGASRSTFLAVPRRVPVLAAQGLTVAAAAALTAVAALGVTFLAILPLRGELVLALDPSDPEATRMLGGFVLYLVGSALLGTALGTLARGPAAGLVAGVVLVFLLEQIVVLLGASWLVAALPGWAGRLAVASDAGAAQNAAQAGVGITPWLGLGVMAVWVVVLFLVAAVRLRRSSI